MHSNHHNIFRFKEIARRFRRAIVISTAAAMMLALQGTALASVTYIYNDSFEGEAGFGNPYGGQPPLFEGTDFDGALIKNNASLAASGKNFVRLVSYSGFGAVGRKFYIGPARYGCYATFAVRAFTRNAKINVEIIDPATYTYIAVKTYTITDVANYHTYATPNPSNTAIRPAPGTEVLVRLSALGSSGVFVDDLMLTCHS